MCPILIETGDLNVRNFWKLDLGGCHFLKFCITCLTTTSLNANSNHLC
jgi:hypothetical protein